MIRRVVAAGVLVLAPAVTAQTPPTGLGAAAGVIAGRDWFVGAGPSVALGVARDVAVTAAVLLGGEAGRTEARAEVMWQYRVPALRGARSRLFGAVGLGATTVDDRGPYLALGAGLLRRVGSAAEWWVETGVGGGVRLVTGVRWWPGTQRRTAPPGRGGP